MSEVLPEDKPSRETIENDEAFDNWMISFENKMSIRTSKQTKVTAQHGGIRE